MSIDNLNWWEWVGFLAAAKDGDVARELLGPASAHPVQQLTEGAAHPFHPVTPFRLPKMRLTEQTLGRAVERQPTQGAAEVLNFVLQVMNSRTACMWALVASRTPAGDRARLEISESYPFSVLEVTYLNDIQEFISGELARNFEGVNATGSRGRRDSLGLDLNASWESRRSLPGTAYRSQEHNISATTKLGRLMWRELGDDPGAWEVALDLLDNPDVTAQEAVDTARSTLDQRAAQKTRKILTPWRFRRPVHLFYEDFPVEGPQDGWGLDRQLRIRHPRSY